MILTPEKVTLKDGRECKLSFNGRSFDYCNLGNLSVIEDEDGAIGVEISGEIPSKMEFLINSKFREFLAITRITLAKYNWCYNQVYVGKKKEEECQFQDFDYPSVQGNNPDCWTYFYTSGDTNGETLDFTAALLGLTEDGNYLAIYPLLSNGTISYIGKGFRVVSTVVGNGKRSWIISYGTSEDPYDAVNKALEGIRKYTNARLRIEKPRPKFIDYLGWCSWNAFLQYVNEEDVINTVRGLVGRGLPIGWVIIDDGWEVIDDKTKAQKSIKPNPDKFPHGFKFLVQSLKSLGIRYVGLWHTLNIYWGGITEEFEEEVGSEGESLGELKYPPSDFDKVLGFYSAFHRALKREGFDFVKVDNQISIENYPNILRASVNIQSALQISSILNQLDVLNCMAMIPESYYNSFNTNLMRSSIDYVPLWRKGGKLHLAINAYNSIFFSGLMWLDFDMFSSYDPLAKAHLVFRVFSGGPVYITDRDVSKTNVELLRRAVLPNGEVVKVDFPALPIKDILFINILKENKMLKVASKTRGVPVVALCNLRGKRLEDSVYLKHLPYQVDFEPTVFYKFFKEEGGLVKDDKIDVELEDGDCEVVVVSTPGLIGLKEYILPPYPVIDGKPIVSGTLVQVDHDGKTSFLK
ncbi:MAG: Sip1-related alpha-galactosidase [Sulfolobaceae archaeon]|nr:Sip1-related alpha-galactosidase [Sulfolobaceae archaeon]